MARTDAHGTPILVKFVVTVGIVRAKYAAPQGSSRASSSTRWLRVSGVLIKKPWVLIETVWTGMG